MQVGVISCCLCQISQPFRRVTGALLHAAEQNDSLKARHVAVVDMFEELSVQMEEDGTKWALMQGK